MEASSALENIPMNENVASEFQPQGKQNRNHKELVHRINEAESSDGNILRWMGQLGMLIKLMKWHLHF